MTTSDVLEAQAQEGFLDAELYARYLNRLGHARRRTLRAVAAVSTVLGSGTLASILAEAPKWVSIAAAALTAGVSGLGVAYGQDSREDSRWLELASKWSRRSASWRSLWKDSLAGKPPTLAQLARERAADSKLSEFDGEVPQRARMIRRIQRQIVRAEGFGANPA